jgi:hypothetical protein
MKKKNLMILLVSLIIFSLTSGFVTAGADPEDAVPAVGSGENTSGAGSPENINPLTGLPVSNPSNLQLPPALVSITNWPPAARPQAGLSYSPIVFELYIGEGMSRFVGMFYGDYPQEALNGNDSPGGNSPSGQNSSDEAMVGPIRSGRLPYRHLQKAYSGFLVMASAYKGVMQNLEQYNNVFGSDQDDINSAMVKVTSIEKIARATQKEIGSMALQVNTFDATPPAGGKPAQRLWYIYNAVDQIIWQYNEGSQAYNRYQDNADGKTFIRATDRLNSEPLTYENVIILTANHRACTETAFDIDLMYIDRLPAVLFRDGQVYNIFWTTKNEEYEKTTGKVRPIRFIDQNGDPFPLKPGQTWVHLVPLYTPVWEAPELSQFGLEGALDGEEWISPNPAGLLYNLLNNKTNDSGEWVSRFFASSMVQDQAVCDALH